MTTREPVLTLTAYLVEENTDDLKQMGIEVAPAELEFRSSLSNGLQMKILAAALARVGNKVLEQDRSNFVAYVATIAETMYHELELHVAAGGTVNSFASKVFNQCHE
ncbi:hypothetical protein ACUY3D_02765 [Corynebacterium guaraldiae]